MHEFSARDAMWKGEFGSDELLDALIRAADTAGLGISVLFTDTDPPEYSFISKKLAEIAGYSVAEVMSRPLWSFVTPAELPRLAALRAARMRGEPPTPVFTTVFEHKSGHQVPVEVATSRVTLGAREANVLFVTDITCRQSAAVALTESEARFRSLVESAPDGVLIFVADRVVFSNPQASYLFASSGPGVPEQLENLSGKSIEQLLMPSDVARFRAQVKNLLERTDRQSAATEYETLPQIGGGRAIELSLTPVEFEGNWATLGFARDIAERKALQSRLMQSDRLAALGALSAGVAHEINNPLTYVLLNLENIIRKLPAIVTDQARLLELLQRLEETKQGAQRVSTIVGDLRTFARSEQDAIEAVDVRSVVDSALKIASNEIRHRARLELDCPPVPAVRANGGRLEQVFLNLLVNAAQALPLGDPATDVIGVRLSQPTAGRVAITISDTGSGMSPATLGHAFDPFFTTKPPGVGTGLGLPICRGIISRLGGEIFIESRENQGTQVTVVLPTYATDEIPTTRLESPLPVPLLGRGKILIVDDEAAVGETLRLLLADDHDVQCLTSARPALQRIQGGEEFDAVLCDLIMPGMTGMDLYSEIARLRPGYEERFIFMSAGAFMQRAAEFLESVHNPVVDKPFDLDRLRSLLQESVDRNRVASLPSA